MHHEVSKILNRQDRYTIMAMKVFQTMGEYGCAPDCLMILA